MSHTALIGAIIDGRYRVLSRLGRGGTSTVYLARDETLERDVAVKVFSRRATELSDAGRRRHEVRLLAGLAHPSIVTLYDAVLDADPPYLTMEYVEGDDLRGRLTDGALDLADAEEIVASIAEGLAFIHDRGVIHRDVKPDNVLVPTGPGRAKLLDFGIARLTEGAAVTTAGAVLGTADYLSPEQARGDTVGPGSDVYSLGLMLAECLTGRRCFPGTDAESMAARLTSRPDLSDPGLASRRALLERMTAPDPEDRPTPLEVADTLTGRSATRVAPAATTAPATVPATAVRTQVMEPPTAAPPPPRRRRGLLVGAIGAGALAILGIVLGLSGLPTAFTAPEPPATGVEALKEKAIPDPVPVVEDDEGPGNGNGNGKEDNGKGNGKKGDR